MAKLLLLVLVSICSMFLPVFAEKIPVKLAPTQVISTHHDEVETGDWINFEIVNDIYLNNNLYIKKNAKVVGIVDFVHPNGWLGDAADIKLINFSTVDVNNKKVEIAYPIDINGSKFIANESKQIIALFLTTLIRGSEIYIEPDSQTFNILLLSN